MAELSSQRQARALREHADALNRRARDFEIGAIGETKLSMALQPLVELGYHRLVDRKWPGRGTANIDLILVGPSGVYLLDAKEWAEPRVERGRLFRGQDDETEQLETLASLLEMVDDELAGIGLIPHEVIPALVLTMAHHQGAASIGRVQILGIQELHALINRRGRRLLDDQIALVTRRLESLFPPYLDPTAEQQVLPVVPQRLAPEDCEIDPVTRAALQETSQHPALTDGVEQWMTFITPPQASLVRQRWNGPVKISGEPGTGKTVVALHRAVHLARQDPGDVLITSFVRTLPAVMSGLVTRMAPEVADRVHCIGVHALARRILSDRQLRVNLDADRCEQLFNRAWSRTRTTRLTDIAAHPQYWRDEVSSVIKGRGLTSFNEYADLDRVGRRIPLKPAVRKDVWCLYLEYQSLLADAGLIDFDDLIIAAHSALRSDRRDPQYQAVIVDEVQDISCMALRMLTRLLGDGPGGLMVIGDGRQAIYPGGFRLIEAGVNVTGRSVHLTVNYRNSLAIMESALGATVGLEGAALDTDDEAGAAVANCVRHGGEVVHHQTESVGELSDWAVTQVLALVRSGTAPADLAVLCTTTATAARILKRLRLAGVAAMDLQDYAGRPVDRIKVGTVKRAKGMEFPNVVLVVEPGRQSPASDEYEMLAMRELFVGMTRARDALWVGQVALRLAS